MCLQWRKASSFPVPRWKTDEKNAKNTWFVKNRIAREPIFVGWDPTIRLSITYAAVVIVYRHLILTTLLSDIFSVDFFNLLLLSR